MRTTLQHGDNEVSLRNGNKKVHKKQFSSTNNTTSMFPSKWFMNSAGEWKNNYTDSNSRNKVSPVRSFDKKIQFLQSFAADGGLNH